MPLSPYLRELRARAGSARLVLPSVTAIVYGPAGEIRDGRETLEARFWSAAEAEALPLAGWLRPVLPSLYARPETAYFHPARWALAARPSAGMNASAPRTPYPHPEGPPCT